MATPKLEKIWIAKFPQQFWDGMVELRLDWSNDYHHAVTIKWPHGPDQVADALRDAAMLVQRYAYDLAKAAEAAEAGRKE